MSNKDWSSLWNYPAPIAAGTALHTSVTLTDISATGGRTVDANFLQPGSVIQLEAFGSFSTTGTPTLLIGAYWGGVAGTKLAATGATTTGSAAASWPWRLFYQGIVRTGGATGTIIGSGYLMLGTSLTAVTTIPIDASAIAAVTVDLTTSKALTVGAQWGTSSASNTITCHGHLIKNVA